LILQTCPCLLRYKLPLYFLSFEMFLENKQSAESVCKNMVIERRLIFFVHFEMFDQLVNKFFFDLKILKHFQDIFGRKPKAVGVLFKYQIIELLIFLLCRGVSLNLNS
jgi:hypothetical protein